MTAVSDVSGGNTIPLDDEGRTYHVGCKSGEVANHILICSSFTLAKEIATNLFDDEDNFFSRLSNRGFHTYTGTFQSSKVSVIGFGIGFAMVDFLIREIRAITIGRLFIVLIGTSPTPSSITVGEVVNIQDCVGYQLDYDKFNSSSFPYQFLDPLKPDEELYTHILYGLKLGGFNAREGRNCSSSSFVSGLNEESKENFGHSKSQFDFKSKSLLKKLQEKYPNILTFENDVYQLFYLASKSTDQSISCAAVSLVGSDMKQQVIDDIELLKKEMRIARAVFSKFAEFV